MEVDSRMHAPAFNMHAYPQHIYDSLAREYYPVNSPTTPISHAYMSSANAHQHNMPSSQGYTTYVHRAPGGTVPGGIAGRFRGDPSLFAGMQPSMYPMNNVSNHPSTSRQRYPGASHMHHSSSLQQHQQQQQRRQHHQLPSPQSSDSTPMQSLALAAPAQSHPNNHNQPQPPVASSSPSAQMPQGVPTISGNTARRETRRSPLSGEAERAPQAAYLYEQSRLMPSSSSSPSWAGISGSTSSSTRLPPILQVEKQQVTTSATQAASASRRRNEANFRCPVPGCGSTFTRRFNLRGHLRSHTEERPFICEWPGCGKGFARQHDCKRHQALHATRSQTTNVCQGCGKTFSRLDALNRHLRSEGGTDCKQTADAVALVSRQSPHDEDCEPEGSQSNGSDRRTSTPQ